MSRRSKRAQQRRRILNKNWPNWQPVGGAAGAYAYPDEYNRPAPDKLDLIRAVTDTAYACISLIANNIGLNRVKLYADMPRGMSPKRCGFKALTARQHYQMKGRLDFTNLFHVTRHELIDLLYLCNSDHNYLEMMVNTVFSLEATGNAYWLKERAAALDNKPTKLVLLPVEKVTPVRDRRTGVIESYDFGTDTKTINLKKEDVIHFRYPNLADLYGEGTSPLAAVWNRVQIAFKETGYLDATLTNNARPDAILSPDSDYGIGWGQAERLQKEVTARYRKAGSGGVMVLGDKYKLEPLSWQPKDLALAELYQNVKLSISNAFHIPPDFWEPGASNRATAETAEYIFALRCLKPRIAYLTEKLTRDLAHEFDERLLFLADEVVPLDKEFELRKVDTLVKDGIMLRSTAQEIYGLPVEDWAREPLIPAGYLPPEAVMSQNVPGTAQQQPQQDQPEGEPEPATAEQAPAAASNDLRATVGGSAAVADLQRSFYRGELSREACMANLVLIFGFTPEEASLLVPQKPAVPPGPPPGQPPATVPPAPAAEAPPAPEPEASQPGQPEAAEEDTGNLSDEEIERLGKEWLEDLQQEWEAQQKGFKCGGEGGSPGPCPTGGAADKPAASTDHHAEATSKAQKAVKLLKELPAAVATKVKAKVQEKYGKLRDRYGKAAAIAIMAAGIAGTATPLPGGGLIAAAPILGACELYLRLRGGPAPVAAAAGEHGHNPLNSASREELETKAQGKTLPPLQLAESNQLTGAVKKFMTRLSWEVEHSIKSGPDISTKAEPAWFDQEQALQDLMEEVFQPLTDLYHHGAKDTAKRIGKPGIFDVVSDHLKPAIDSAVLEFAKSTLATTTQDLDTARRMLKEELHEGLDAGEAKVELQRRVQKVFNAATNERAFLIGTSEASRAQHAAELMTARESGVVKGKTWLPDANACDLCRELSGKTVGLDEDFVVDGTGPYAKIGHPPRHPNCKCTQLLVI